MDFKEKEMNQIFDKKNEIKKNTNIRLHVGGNIFIFLFLKGQNNAIKSNSSGLHINAGESIENQHNEGI